MQYQSFLIKYAEIGTKGKNRYMFEDALIRQIRYALSSVDGEFDVTKESGRIYVKALGEYEYDDTIEALKRVFGIADICPMVQIEDKDYENLKKHVVEYMDQVYPDKNITFKVDARRGDKQYPVSSEQINRDMGEAILEAFPQMKVDVHHPDVLLRVPFARRIFHCFRPDLPITIPFWVKNGSEKILKLQNKSCQAFVQYNFYHVDTRNLECGCRLSILRFRAP